jgi:hypothetical protein
MIRRAVAWLAGGWRGFWYRKVEQARKPQAPELAWVKERAGRIEAEMQTAVRRAKQQEREAWRTR